jgi:hypothetical protein
MDSMCSVEAFSPLPKRPPPEMYPYRGDLINARNGKLQAKKAAKKKLPVRAKSKPTGDGGLKPLHTNVKENEGPEWDGYCQYISSTKLSADEQDAKTKNKERIVSYLRSEAKKRHQKAALELKLRAELKDNEEMAVVEVAKKPKKPPVPRLSYMARTGNKTKAEIQALNRDDNDGNKLEEKSVKPKARSYLEFISTKTEKPKPPERAARKSQGDKAEPVAQEMHRTCQQLESTSVSAMMESNDNDDIFRSRIEEIVRKAAAVVMEEQRHSEDPEKYCQRGVNSPVLAEAATSAASFLASESIELKTERADFSQANDTQNKCGSQYTSHESDLSHAQSRLQELLERIQGLSLGSSIMREINGELGFLETRNHIGLELQPDSATHVSEITSFQDKSVKVIDRTEQKQPELESIGNYSASHDSSTEIFPRASIQPTHFHSTGQRNTNANVSCRTPKGTSSSSNDKFSWSVTLSNATEHNTLTSKRRIQYPAILIQEEMNGDIEQPMPTSILPSAIPTQPVEWEEEPVPRGYESHSQQEDIDVADDILSLL